MASDVIMPQMGFDMTEGMVVRWLKREGDVVTRGESIAEIETDKATVELEAYESGVMARILVSEGVVVPVGETIGLIAEPASKCRTFRLPLKRLRLLLRRLRKVLLLPLPLRRQRLL